MLLIKCKELSQQAQTVADLKKYASDLKNFQDCEEKIQALVKELKPVVIAFLAFRKRIPEQFDLEHPTVDSLLVEVNETLTAFRQNRGCLIENFNIKPLKTKVKRLKDELDKLLQEKWKIYKQQNMPKTNNDLLALLGRIETFQPTVERIKSLHAQITTVSFPKDAEHFQRLDQGINDMADAWSSLRSNEVSESVLHFLRAASTNGASLDSFTPEVEDWLKEQGITRFFQVKLAD